VAAFGFAIVPPAPVTIVEPGARAAAFVPAAAVAGVADASVLRVRALALPSRIGATRLRAQGLRISMRVPADAVVVRLAVHRADRNGRPAGTPLATAVRLAPGAKATMRVRLRDRAVRRLRPGRYVVAVAAGRSRTALGPAATRPVTVTR